MKFPKPHRRRVEVVIGDPMSSQAKASEMEEVIRDLLGDKESAAKPIPKKLKFNLKRRKKKHDKTVRRH